MESTTSRIVSCDFKSSTGQVETGLDLLQLSEAGQWLSSHVLQKGGSWTGHPLLGKANVGIGSLRPCFAIHNVNIDVVDT